MPGFLSNHLLDISNDTAVYLPGSSFVVFTRLFFSPCAHARFLAAPVCSSFTNYFPFCNGCPGLFLGSKSFLGQGPYLPLSLSPYCLPSARFPFTIFSLPLTGLWS